MQTFTLQSNGVHGEKDRGSICCDVLLGIHIASLLTMKSVPIQAQSQLLRALVSTLQARHSERPPSVQLRRLAPPGEKQLSAHL